jgi:hypothetical protein
MDGARGLRLHTTLAVRLEGWDLDERPQSIVLGVLAQQCLNRWGQPRRAGETWRQRMSRARESQRWGAVLEAGGPPVGSTWIYVADREADFYESIQRGQRQRVDFIIRACHDRALSGGQGHLKAMVAQAPVCDQLTIALRARPGRTARKAQVEMRTSTLDLNGPWRLGGKQPDFQVNVVEVREVGAPEGVEPLHWLLLTPVDAKVFGPELLALLAAQLGKPKGGWTHRTALVSVARVDGFLARRGDGLPGWQTIWRGWNRLMWMCHGLKTLKSKRKRCGQ